MQQESNFLSFLMKLENFFPILKKIPQPPQNYNDDERPSIRNYMLGLE